METYLTEAELEREENLLKPHSEKYNLLKRRKQQLKDMRPKMSIEDDARKPPPSC